MLLAFDAGNTNIVLGVFSGEKLLHNWRFSTDSKRTPDEYGIICRELFSAHGLDFADATEMIISSVVPEVTRTLEQVGKQYFSVDPLIVGSGIKTGLSMRYENPKEIGADRVVNAVAVKQFYGKPAIIVDFGTATTFCALAPDGAYLGGAITSGIGISMDALFSNAAKLPKVDLTAPDKAIGRTTVNAMQSGLVYGYASLVDGMIERIAEEMGYKPKEMMIVATGGRSIDICKHTKYVKHIDPILTLRGLAYLNRLNKEHKERGTC